MSPYQERVRDLLEEVFIAGWGKTTPVKLSHKPSYPPAPWVQLSTVFGDTYSKANCGQCQFGVFGVGVIFPLNEGMEFGLDLAGQATQILNFQQFQKDALIVNCKKTCIVSRAREENRYCYLLVSAEFAAEEKG